MPYDLFVSYSRKDNREGRIAQLVERIEADFLAFAGRPLVPFFDAAAIRGMEDWRHRILQGLRESRLLLVCLSPSYFASPYCEWEFNEYLKHEIGRATFGDGVAPIYFVDVPQWSDAGFGERRCAWVAELRRRQRFDLRPWYREGEGCLRDATVRERMHELNAQLQERIGRGERAERGLGNVDAHDLHFIGRTAELRRLRETLALGKVGVLTAVHGLGGVGKTALAVEYAHAFAHEYGGGCWQVRCEGRDDLAAAIAELASPLALRFTEDEAKDTARQLQRVLAELRRLADARVPHRALLLLDNVDRSRLLEPAQTQRLPAAEWLHVLATTRLGADELHGRLKDRAFLPVDELPQADAVELIEGYQPGGTFAGADERAAAEEIVTLLGRFTLAVETAAVYLGQFAEDVTCAAFLARLRNEGLAGLDLAAEQAGGGARHREMRVGATLAPTIERLAPPQRLALAYAALLPAEQVALPWLRTLVAQLFPEVARDAEPGYPDPWQAVLRRLLGLRLLLLTAAQDPAGKPRIVRMHRVIASTVIAMHPDRVLIEQALARLVQERTGCLHDAWWKDENRWEADPLLALALSRPAWIDVEPIAGPLGWALTQLGRLAPAAELLLPFVPAEGAAASSNEHAPAIARSLCLLKSKQGLYPQAVRLGDLAYAGHLDQYGEVHPETIRSLNLLCLTRIRRGDLSEVEPLVREAAERSAASLGRDDPDALASRSNLAYLLTRRQQFEDAEPICREALASREQVLGPDHPDTLVSLDLLGYILSRRGQVDDAYTVMRRLLDQRRSALGPGHPDSINAMTGLAFELSVRGRIDEAEQLANDALSEAEKSLGAANPATLMAMQRVAEILEKKGDFARAKAVALRLMSTADEALGRDNAFTAAALSMLAAIASQEGDLDAQEDALRRALVSRERVLGSEHPDSVHWRSALAGVHQQRGEFEQAEKICRSNLTIAERIWGPENPNTLNSLNDVAGLLQSRGDFVGAEPLLRRVLASRERILGPSHPDTLTTRNTLAYVLVAKGDLAGAEPLMRQVNQAQKQLLGSTHPDTLQSFNNLAVLLRSKGDLSGAEVLLRRAIDGRERMLGPAHPDTLLSLSSLGVLLQAKGDFAGAEQLYRSALEGFERTLGPMAPATLSSAQNLAGVLEAEGDLTGAEFLYRRALDGREQMLGKSNPNTLSSLQHLANLLDKTGQAEDAKQLRVRRIQAVEASTATPPLDLRTAALDAYRLGDYALAGTLLERALAQGFEPPGTQTHLARIALVTGDVSGAATRAAQAWDCRTEAPPYVVPRILWLLLAVRLLSPADSPNPGTEPSVLLGRLKTALQAEGAHLEWAMDPVLAHLETQLAPKDHALLTALVAALNFSDNLSALDAFPAWREAEPASLD